MSFTRPNTHRASVLCRRQLLQAGYSAALGLGLSGVVAGRKASAANISTPLFGRAKSVIFNGLMEDLFSRNKVCRCGWEGRTVGEDLEVGGRVGLFVLRGGCESRDLLVTCCAVVAAVAVRENVAAVAARACRPMVRRQQG